MTLPRNHLEEIDMNYPLPSQPGPFALRALLLILLLTLPAAIGNAEDPGKISSKDMAAMMEQARALTQPTAPHQELSRFLGTWDTALKITMGGANPPAEKGEMTFSWLMDGRWIQGKGEGTTMGMPSETFTILGYDNFKQSYVTVTVGNIDTAMLTAEGDMDPSGKALITYGTLDEYLTGEHDKMVKYVWRFLSDDEMLLELHDLPIGEANTKVVEIRFNRRKEARS